MVERDEAKGMDNKSGCTTDWQTYCKLRNHVTKPNFKKETKNNSKMLWAKRQTQLHHSLKQMAHSSQNPLILPTTLMIFFIGKISKFRHDMPATNTDTTHPSIADLIMKDKRCNFEFHKVSVRGEKSIVGYQQ